MDAFDYNQTTSLKTPTKFSCFDQYSFNTIDKAFNTLPSQHLLFQSQHENVKTMRNEFQFNNKATVILVYLFLL